MKATLYILSSVLLLSSLSAQQQSPGIHWDPKGPPPVFLGPIEDHSAERDLERAKIQLMQQEYRMRDLQMQRMRMQLDQKREQLAAKRERERKAKRKEKEAAEESGSNSLNLVRGDGYLMPAANQ